MAQEAQDRTPADKPDATKAPAKPAKTAEPLDVESENASTRRQAWLAEQSAAGGDSLAPQARANAAIADTMKQLGYTGPVGKKKTDPAAELAAETDPVAEINAWSDSLANPNRKKGN